MGDRKEPRLVIIGGGTGMPVLLRGLKNFPVQLAALVTVADDGGSSGKLRNEMSIPAPGDIRNVIAALSDVEPMLIQLFQHRFSIGNGLSGHSLGNMLLAAMTSVTGDFYTGIKEISRVLNVKGNIYPISNESISLHAEMDDGEIIVGESNIPRAKKKIKRVFLKPDDIRPLPNAVEAIANADVVIISPGSLYTSILPNIIIPGIIDVMKDTKAKIVYVCNVMTQEGETTGYTASDHVQAIDEHLGQRIVDSIVVHNEPIRKKVRDRYAKENAQPVEYDMERLLDMGLQIIEGDIIDDTSAVLRHDTEKISRLLYSIAQQTL
ncbi:MAG TPA: YvcK family protein [Bacillota bacterium]|nr:YvcK family protein [Bacillota bacterium]